MEKVRLTVDELRVQSFTTTGGAAGSRGTIRGYDAPTDPVECPTADVNWNTCWNTCQCEGNTGDCTAVCESDRCSANDCSVFCYTEVICTRGGGVFATLC